MKNSKFHLKIYCAALICCCNCQLVSAQDYCGSSWYDTMGPLYYNSPPYYEEETFCPDNPGDKISIQFNEVDLPADEVENCTYSLIFYDGASDDDSIIAYYCGTTLIEGNENAPDSILSAGDIITSTNENGCIKAIFFTNGGIVLHTGWEAFISCAPPENCQSPTITTTTEMDCENNQYYTRLTVANAPTSDSIATLLVKGYNGGQLIEDTMLPNTLDQSILLGPYPSQTHVNYTISTPGYSCPVLTSTEEICPPPNDDCSNATVITESQMFTGTLMGSEDNEVCFTYTPEVTSAATIFMCSEVIDIVGSFDIYSNSGPINLISSGFDDCVYSDLPYIEFIAEAGVTYTISVSGYAPPWIYYSYLNYSLIFDAFPLVCSTPELLLTPTDSAGNEILCSIPGAEIYISATVTNGNENGYYDLTAQSITQTVQNNSTVIMGPFTAGADLQFTLTEHGNYWCVTTEAIATVCNASLKVMTNMLSLCTGWNGTIKFYYPGSTDIAFEAAGILDETGAYNFSSVPEGDYNIFFKPDGYLQISLGEISINSAENNVEAPLLFPGDANENNGVNIADASAVAAAFNTGTGTDEFNPSVDYNCDGYISIIDFSAIIPGFNSSGAEPEGS